MTVNSVNTYIVPTTANEVTMPAQPAFLGTIAADPNVTGNGTVYTVGTNTAFTQIYDQNADFNTNGTFTSPVTGRYNLISTIAADAANGATDGILQIVTSNRTYITTEFNPDTFENAGGGVGLAGETVADMDAADTATITIEYTGAGGDTVDLRSSYYCGYLAT